MELQFIREINQMKRKQAREPNYCSDYNTSHLSKSDKLRKQTK